MEYKDVDLNLLRIFEAVMKTRSVTRAGQVLGLSQPAMSYALRHLRELFKDPLFVRSQNTLLPTPRARELATPIAEVLESIRRNVLQSGEFHVDSVEREFAFCLTEIGQILFLPVLVQRVRDLAPNVTVCVRSIVGVQLASALESGEVDLAIGHFPDLPGSVFQQRLYEEDAVCLCRADHPQIDNAITQRQYLDLPHVIVRSPMRAIESIEKELERQSIKRRSVVIVPDYVSLPGLLESSELIATVPHTIARALCRFGAIKIIALPFNLSKRTVHQYWHSRYNHDSANRWLRGVVYEQLAG